MEAVVGVMILLTRKKGGLSKLEGARPQTLRGSRKNVAC